MEKWLALIEKNSYHKSSAESEVYRKQGNKHFGQKDSWGALEYYSRSILWAPPLTESIAVAFGNRSAVLFELTYYQECLRDIDRCLATKQFPETSFYKLYSRRLKCLAKLGDKNSRLRKEIEGLTDYLTKAELDVVKKATVLKEAEALISKNNILKLKDSPVSSPVPALLFGSNPRISNLSEAVRLAYTKTAGRLLLATKPIQSGNVVMIEKPYASVLLPHCYDKFCHHCHKHLPLDYVPCDNCAQIRFCGDACRDIGWHTYHWLECGSLDLLHEMGLAHLALRIILMTDVQQILKYLRCDHVALEEAQLTDEERNERDRQGLYGLREDEHYESDYEAVYNLLTHEKEMDTDDVKIYYVAARFLSILLERKGYYKRLEKLLPSAPFVCTECKMMHGMDDPAERAIAKLEQRSVSRSPPAPADKGKSAKAIVANGSVVGKKKPATTNCSNARPGAKNHGKQPAKKSDADSLVATATNWKESVATAAASIEDVLEKAMVRLLVRHLQQLVCNAHAITCVVRFSSNSGDRAASGRGSPNQQNGGDVENGNGNGDDAGGINAAANSATASELQNKQLLRKAFAAAACSQFQNNATTIAGNLSEAERPGSPSSANANNNSLCSIASHPSFLESTDQIRIASAVYPTAALMNHSCEPNIFSSFVGNMLVIRAVRPIEIGGELLNCYGPHVGRMHTADRRAALAEQYYFKCQCSGCSQKMPCSVNIKEAHEIAYKCQFCGGPVFRGNPDDKFADIELLRNVDERGPPLAPDEEPKGFCNSCRKTQPMQIKIAVMLMNNIPPKMDSGIPPLEGARSLYENLFKLEEVLYRHNRVLSSRRDRVARYLAENGLFDGAAKIVLRNLDTIKFFYGSDTIEVANEYQKLIDIEAACLEQKLGSESDSVDEIIKNLREHIDAAADIFRIYYGPDSAQIEELMQLKRMLGFV